MKLAVQEAFPVAANAMSRSPPEQDPLVGASPGARPAVPRVHRNRAEKALLTFAEGSVIGSAIDR